MRRRAARFAVNGLAVSKMSCVALLTLLLLAWRGVSAAAAGECTSPDHFVDVPHVASLEQLVSHTEEVTIERSLGAVMYAASETKLENAIAKTDSLPSVLGT